MSFRMLFRGVRMKEEIVHIVCEKCGYEFTEKTDKGEWNQTSDNCFGYVDVITVCPKCGYENSFPLVREEHGYINNLVLEKLKKIKVHPVFLGMMLNIEYPVVMKEITENCSKNKSKALTKLKQIINFIQSKECNTFEDLYIKMSEFTGPLNQENNNIHEMLIYSKSNNLKQLEKNLKKEDLLYKSDKEKREYRFDCVYKNYLFHHIVIDSSNERYKVILPYLYDFRGIHFMNEQEAYKHESYYQHCLKKERTHKMEKKLSKKKLEKMIREKIQEHEFLTNYQGNCEDLDEKSKQKAGQLYKEIERLIKEYVSK